MRRHICHISTTFNLKSGNARRTAAIIRGCEDEGYRTSLIVGDSNDIPESYFRATELYVVPGLAKYINPIKDFQGLFHLSALIRRLKPDLVHTHLAKAGILGRLAARNAKVPKILHTVHGPSFPDTVPYHKYLLYRQLERVCGRFTDMFVFVGTELRQTYLDASVCTSEKSVVIRTGRDMSHIDASRPNRHRIQALRQELCSMKQPQSMIVNVGRLVPSKQQHHSISALRMLLDRGLKSDLIIVGEAFLGEEKRYEIFLKDYARKEGVGNRVHFAGYRDDILDVIAAADALVLTSRYEGLPNVLVEAALVGTLFVAYEVGGVDEILRLTRLGYVTNQGSLDGIVEALSRIIRSAPGDPTRSSGSRDMIMKYFSEKTMIQEKKKLYAHILG